MRKFDNRELQQEVQKFWESNRFPFELVRSLDFPRDEIPSTTLKVKSEVFDRFGWFKPASMSAYELAHGAFIFLSKHVQPKSKVVLYQTLESIVAPFITGAEHVAEADKYTTSYYSGSVGLSPPEINAWLTLHIEPIDGLEAGMYAVDSEGESLDF